MSNKPKPPDIGDWILSDERTPHDGQRVWTWSPGGEASPAIYWARKPAFYFDCLDDPEHHGMRYYPDYWQPRGGA